MKEKTAKILTWSVLLLVPILPSYMVIAAINVRLVMAICIFVIEYFAYQYVIALFIRRVALRIQYEREKSNETIDNKEVKIE